MAMNNTSTKKQYPGYMAEPASDALPSKTAKYNNAPPKKTPQLSGTNQEFAEPMNDGISAKLRGISGLHNDIGEMSGFITEGYIDKNGIPFGESAKFNFLPPGMEITNQENIEVHDMPFRTIVGTSYPGDGWSPTPRDVKE